MIRISRALASLVLALALTACVTVTEAPSGQLDAGAYSITLGRSWSDVSQVMLNRPKYVRLLTLDGPLLNRLYLVDGLEPGQFIVKPARKEQPTPTYRTGMSPTELVELIADSVSALEFQRVETQNLRPAKVGDADGLSFDISAMTKEGLQVSGRAAAAERDSQLYVLLFLAPAEHYFTAVLPEVENIFGSVHFHG